MVYNKAIKISGFISIVLDINECILGTHKCSHFCKNTIGTYICGCQLGCQLVSDGLSCQGNKF